MRGKEVFYPIGWDDNGLPTERRVQNYYHVRCEPSLTSGAIAAIRGAKSGARLSMRAPVSTLVVTGQREHLDALRAVLADLSAAGRVGRTELRERDQPEPDYQVTL